MGTEGPTGRRVAEEEKPGPRTPPEGPGRSAGKRVLIVDDDGASRQGLVALAARWGYAAEEAGDGREGLERARAGRPDIVVTDLRLPGFDGLELLRALRDELPSTVVIVLTGHASVETAVAAMKEGAYDYLTKPVDVARLRILLEKAVDRADTVREVALLRRQVAGQRRGRARRRQRRHARACSGSSSWPRRSACPCSSWARAGRARSWWPGPSTRGQPRAERAVRGRQLLGGARDAARERALRPRARGLHGRGRAAPGLLRAGPRRHDLPRRDRRDDAGAAGEAPAGAPGAACSAGSAARTEIKVDVRVIAATNRGPSKAIARGRVPRRPLSTASTCSHRRCRRCASARTTSAAARRRVHPGVATRSTAATSNASTPARAPRC